MRSFGGLATVTALLAINGGFVDAAAFLGLQGLFTAHVTGNFVTLGAALVLGGHGIIGKLLALPEFIAFVALARLAGDALRRSKAPVFRVMLATETALLLGFLVLAIVYGPFPNPDSPIALLAGLFAVAAMAVQNAVQRVHLPDQPPTTIMTGNTTQATLDAVDLLTGNNAANAATRSRFVRIALSIVYFTVGCAAAALLYWYAGFWCLIVPVAIAACAAAIAEAR